MTTTAATADRIDVLPLADAHLTEGSRNHGPRRMQWDATMKNLLANPDKVLPVPTPYRETAYTVMRRLGHGDDIFTKEITPYLTAVAIKNSAKDRIRKKYGQQ